jgi:lipopolysaccharide biosynthesis glycosyltransferase
VRVYIGYDPREYDAYRKADATLIEQSGIVHEPLVASRLAAHGIYSRPYDARGGKIYDIPSQAHAATEFAVTRFLTPILCQTGMALFTDCDVIFLDDVRRMLDEIEPGKAVYVVKHKVVGSQATKMDGQPQQFYRRKNWSSVMLFDCDHPANRRLTLHDVNNRPGRDLHGFYWLHDDEIGELPARWNWLVNVQPKPDRVGIAHFTLGGPWFPDWIPSQNDDLWLEA